MLLLLSNNLNAQTFTPALSAAPIPTTTVAVRDICRIKGQEENTIQGIGLVVGLNGTGDDGSKPTIRSLARMAQLLGGNIATDANGLPVVDEVADARNAAAVMITAKIPPVGAQQGDLLDCHVNAISASSLEGGRLMITHLHGPRADQRAVYALAEGRISLPDPNLPTSGVIANGCKMEATVNNGFIDRGKVTLVLQNSIASFSNAYFVEDAIDEFLNQGALAGASSTDSYIEVKAIDAHHVEVKVPKIYEDNPVKFLSLLLDVPLTNIEKKKSVIINERDGIVIVGEEVLISPVAITHKNLSIEAQPPAKRFVGLDQQSPGNPRPRLKNLVDALNSLQVPTQDTINIIRTLHRNGDIYGELTFL
jgi:flagellar P-ring protein precursor FlgI